MTPLFDATIVTQLNRFSDETIAAYDEKAWVRERESVWERRERVGKQLRESFESTLPRCYGSLVRLEIVSSNTHVCVCAYVDECVGVWMRVWMCVCVACLCVCEWVCAILIFLLNTTFWTSCVQEFFLTFSYFSPFLIECHFKCHNVAKPIFSQVLVLECFVTLLLSRRRRRRCRCHRRCRCWCCCWCCYCCCCYFCCCCCCCCCCCRSCCWCFFVPDK